MHNGLRPREVGLWLLAWIVLMVIVFALLPHRQAFWTETVVIVATALATYAVVARVNRRRTTHS